MEEMNTEMQFEDEFETAKDIKKTVQRFVKSLGKQKIRLSIVTLSVVAYSVLSILAPLYSAKAIDEIWNGIVEMRTLGKSFSITWECGGKQLAIPAVIYLASAIFYVLQNFLMASFAEKLNYRYRSEIAEKLQRLPMLYYDRRQVGEIMSYVTNDLDRISETLQTGLIRMIVSVGTFCGSVIMMLKFNVGLTLVFIAFAVISATVTKLVSKRTLNCAAQRQQAIGKMNAFVEEAYSGRTVIKAFNYEDVSSQKMRAAAESLARTSAKTDFLMNAVTPLTRLINRCGTVIIAILGGGMLLGGKMTPGVFQAFFQYMNQAGEPITELSYMISSLQSALASAERVFAFLDENEIEAEPKNPKTFDGALGTVEFLNVSFGYTPQKQLMKNVSFRAEAGCKTAIVGSTGAGKTTLVNLLMRFYEINGGKILLDGISTKDTSRKNLRGLFGMVLQDTWLFEGTVAENIAYGKPNASMQEIVVAAKAARADFFIRTLPNGYDTVLTNDAENISIGQRQLLTIARVFLRNPAILILDEATSSVDTETETEIGKAMKELMRGRTSFAIAHRLSTVVDADNILMMQNGNIIEQGSHAELLKANGAYAELYNSQFA